MTIKEMEIPLQDVLEETAWGIENMNTALEQDDANLSATEASVNMKFMASLSRGHTYTRENHTAGGAFTFWLIGGAGGGSYTKTELRTYSNYSEQISIEIDVTFEPLAEDIQ
ncbi:MAG: hypothetical protein V5A28_09960 [Haloarculaceae archaeon]